MLDFQPPDTGKMRPAQPDFKQFKKLLVDLDMTQTEIGEAVGISQWAVTRYFRGDLKNPKTRNRIRRVLQRRAKQKGVSLPPFWQDRQ
jgi:hypothetical protein